MDGMNYKESFAKFDCGLFSGIKPGKKSNKTYCDVRFINCCGSLLSNAIVSLPLI